MVVDGSGVGTIQAQWGTIATTNSVKIYSSTVKVNDGAPHHVVMTWDYNTATNSGVWVDGNFTNTSTSTSRTKREDSGQSIGAPASRFAGSTYNFPNYFIGTIDEMSFWQNTTLTSTQIANRYQIGQGTYLSGQTTGNRMAAILTMIGWPSDGSSIYEGLSTCQAIRTNGKTALNALQECEAAEQGKFFAGANGQLKFIDRYNLATNSTYTTSQRTYGDGSSELPYTNIDFVYNDRLVRNRITISRNNGSTVTVDDTNSQASYFIRSFNLSGFINDTDSFITDLARNLLTVYSQPAQRIEGLALTPRADPSGLYSVLIGDEIGTRVTTKRRPQGIGSPISKELFVEGISHSIGTRSWTTNYKLSPVTNTINFVLDSPTFGVLNQSLLGY